MFNMSLDMNYMLYILISQNKFNISKDNLQINYIKFNFNTLANLVTGVKILF